MIVTRLETIRLKEFGNVLWLKVHTADGLFGLGETFMWPATVEAHIHERIAPYLIGRDPLQIDNHWRNLYGYLGFRSTGAEMRAVSALDIALWDLWGKATAQPLYQLLGGSCRASIRTYNTCAGYRYIRNTTGQTVGNFGLPAGKATGPYEDLDGFLHRADEVALSLLDEGITAMKIWPFDFAATESDGMYMTDAQLKASLEPFEKIRRAVGDRMDIMVEFHSLWNLPAAIKIAAALEPYRPFWMEDPIKVDSVENLAEYRARTRCAVTASETVATRWGFRDLLEARACDFVMPDIGWCGGIGEAKKIATMAEAFSIPIAPHDCTGPVVLAASTHLSMNAPNAVFQESVRAFYSGWYKEIVTGLPLVTAGQISVGSAPGHGVDFAGGILSRPDVSIRVST